jgi:selenocysteine lyase/cysteine desulfurase
VTTELAGHDPEHLVTELRRRRINASASLAWYGLIDMAEKRADGALRLSPHYYNTLEEVDAAIEALREIVSARS